MARKPAVGNTKASPIQCSRTWVAGFARVMLCAVVFGGAVVAGCSRPADTADTADTAAATSTAAEAAAATTAATEPTWVYLHDGICSACPETQRAEHFANRVLSVAQTHPTIVAAVFNAYSSIGQMVLNQRAERAGIGPADITYPILFTEDQAITGFNAIDAFLRPYETPPGRDAE